MKKNPIQELIRTNEKLAIILIDGSNQKLK